MSYLLYTDSKYNQSILSNTSWRIMKQAQDKS
jgi:hypothetical protein